MQKFLFGMVVGTVAGVGAVVAMEKAKPKDKKIIKKKLQSLIEKM